MQERRSTRERGDRFEASRQRARSSVSTLEEPVLAWMEGWNRTVETVYDTWMQAVETSWEPFLRQPVRERRSGAKPSRTCTCEDRKSECDCGCYGCGDCTCQCCIGDVDLVVHSRVGERRVVPVVIENPSRREREIEISLSDWAGRSGQSQVKINAAFLDPLTFTLPPCGEKTLTLLITSTSANPQDNPDASNNEAGRITDVDTCQVLTADLRVKGCDIRPIRIAVSLLPRDCDPFVIDCQCGCC